MISQIEGMTPFNEWKPTFSGPVIPTGSYQIDDLIGIGGWPGGRISLVWGGEGIGKSTLMNQTIAMAQLTEKNKFPALFDSETTFDPRYASTLGVDTNRLAYSQPSTIEEYIVSLWKVLERPDLFSIAILDSAVMPSV